MNQPTHLTLHWRTRLFPIGEAEFVVGRDERCHLVVDDERVSRRHAAFRVAGDMMWVRDLGSRNGVLLNGRRIEQESALQTGDLVLIGSQEFRVGPPVSERSRAETRAAIEAAPSDPPANPEGAVSDCWARADTARRSQDLKAAERHVREGLARVDKLLTSGTIGPAALEEATRQALRLAAATGDGAVIDWIFRTHQAVGRPLSIAVIEELDRVARAVRYRVGSPMRVYLDTLEERIDAFGPSEKFAVRRIHALLRTLQGT